MKRTKWRRPPGRVNVKLITGQKKKEVYRPKPKLKFINSELFCCVLFTGGTLACVCARIERWWLLWWWWRYHSIPIVSRGGRSNTNECTHAGETFISTHSRRLCSRSRHLGREQQRRNAVSQSFFPSSFSLQGRRRRRQEEGLRRGASVVYFRREKNKKRYGGGQRDFLPPQQPPQLHIHERLSVA
jgi:hypothetical protein